MLPPLTALWLHSCQESVLSFILQNLAWRKSDACHLPLKAWRGRSILNSATEMVGTEVGTEREGQGKNNQPPAHPIVWGNAFSTPLCPAEASGL